MRRWAHSVIGVAFYLVIIRFFSPWVLESFLLPFFILVVALSSIFPDLDLAVMRRFPSFGHRNPLTHSALAPIALAFVTERYSSLLSSFSPLVSNLAIAFSLGVSSHLLADLKGGGRVRGFRGKRGRAWLILNALVALPWPLSFIAQSLSTGIFGSV